MTSIRCKKDEFHRLMSLNSVTVKISSSSGVHITSLSQNGKVIAFREITNCGEYYGKYPD